MAQTRTLKTRFVKAICHPRVGRTLVAVTGGQARCRGARFDVSTWEPHLAAAVMYRLYERAEARFALSYLADSRRVLELGGNRGVVSSVLLQKLPPDAELVSVEANPGLVPDLQRNLARNSGGRRVEGRHVALSDGSLVLFDASNGALGSALSATAGEPVPTRTLGELVDDLGWDEFALVSDIEGAEVSFVYGDASGLERCRRMVIELHDTSYRGREVSVADLIDTLGQRHGFRLIKRHRDVCVLERA